MATLDTATLMVVLGIFVAMGAVAMVLLWIRNRGEAGLDVLALACLGGAASGSLAGLAGPRATPVEIMFIDITSTLFFTGAVEGVRRWLGRRPLPLWPFVAAGLHGALSLHLALTVDDANGRVLLTGGIMLLCALGTGWLVALESRPATRFSSGVLLAAVLTLVFGVSHYLLHLPPSIRDGIFVTQPFAIGLILSGLLFLAGLFMAVSERNVERMERLRAEAEERERLKSRFLAVMSHEIRTPMNGVLGLSELLLDTELTHRQQRWTANMRSSGRVLLRILNDVLELSKIEAGRLEIEESVFDVRDFVHWLKGLVLGAADRKGLTVATDVQTHVPEKMVGDPRRLGQVMLKLLANGIRYTESGGVALWVRTTERGIVFAVRDSGVGIEDSELPGLFEPFGGARLGETARPSGRGGRTGLGLTIARHLVELMEGSLEVTSTSGVGSTFSVELPLVASDGPAVSLEDIQLRPIQLDEISRPVAVVADRPESPPADPSLGDPLGHRR
ncbi:MAG: ATP-binding protein [Acidobacteriota bacterium]